MEANLEYKSRVLHKSRFELTSLSVSSKNTKRTVFCDRKGKVFLTKLNSKRPQVTEVFESIATFAKINSVCSVGSKTYVNYGPNNISVLDKELKEVFRTSTPLLNGHLECTID